MTDYYYSRGRDPVRDAIHGYMGEGFDLPTSVLELEAILIGIRNEILSSMSGLTSRQREHLDKVESARKVIAEQVQAAREEQELKACALA